MAAKDIIAIDLSYYSDTKTGISESSMKLALDQIKKLDASEIISFVFTGIVLVDGKQRCLQALVGNLPEVTECMKALLDKYHGIDEADE